MTADDLLLMAYVDGALNWKGRRLIARRLACEPELRMRQLRLETTHQLTKLSIADVGAGDANARTVGLLLKDAPTVLGRRRAHAVALYGLTAFLLGVLIGGIGMAGSRFGASNTDTIRATQGSDARSRS